MKADHRLFYFGCIKQPGHFLWEADGYKYYSRQKMPGLNFRVLEALDGVFTPAGINEKEGLYQESIVPPVRIVAWWDRSVDGRGACNSVFVGYGYDSAEEILDDAVKVFSSVMNRQPRPVLFIRDKEMK